MTTFLNICLTILGVICICYIICFVTRFMYAVYALNKIHTMICSKTLNEIGWLTAGKKWRAITLYNQPYTDRTKLIEACANRLIEFVCKPWIPTSIYIFAPTPKMAYQLQTLLKQGVITDNRNELIKLTEEFRVQMDELLAIYDEECKREAQELWKHLLDEEEED